MSLRRIYTGALERAGQMWCHPTLSSRTLDFELTVVVAELLSEEWNKPHLGCATTKELQTELETRMMSWESKQEDYRTVDDPPSMKYPYSCAVCNESVTHDLRAGQDVHIVPTTPYHHPVRPGRMEGTVEVDKKHYLFLIEQANKALSTEG